MARFGYFVNFVWLGLVRSGWAGYGKVRLGYFVNFVVGLGSVRLGRVRFGRARLGIILDFGGGRL